ncbi:hypothetical protein SD427_16785 [Chryseobacterium sp. JJR-5R]|uniref:hypothetical protein n=1 Tax=Chryseobacterium sp. JJR-5R TaxID=3093923 RepID=UPI002A75666A|nr:hypothetical protein [Chryseobacterium sp. JJR-5R]WPO82399.1 hypothetical protein SD427_16785 [Chryseobacterium sp. JJR-5R]
MENKFLVGLLFILSFLVSCQEKKAGNIDIQPSKNSLKPDQDINIMLKKQLEYGKPSFDNPYQYSEKDLDVTVPVLSQILTDNGYKPISNDEFNTKIKQIFNRIIDPKSAGSFLYVNFLDQCERSSNYAPNDAENNGIFIIKNLNFITDLYPIPYIIDYQKLYNEAAQKEDISSKTYKDANGNEVKKYLWKDISNLKEQRKKNIQTLAARNMYLFNDSRAQYKWLVINDQYFMERLVKNFGYTEDSELLKWVIEKTEFDKNNPSDYGKLFWTKECNGNMKLHADTFKLLQKLYIPNDSSENRFILDHIKDYFEYLGNKEISQTENLTPVERIKIMSNLAYFVEQYKYDPKFNEDNKMMGRLRFFLGDKDREILKENNYFGLPKFREWWGNADYDEYFVTQCEYEGTCGPDYQPVNYTEWRKQHPKK